MRNLSMAVIAAAAACGVGTSVAPASVIVSDTLTNTYVGSNGVTTNLNGSTADTTGTGSWLAPPASPVTSLTYSRGASGVAIPASGTGAALYGASFPLTIATGTTYTLSCTFSLGTATSSSGDWLCLEFNATASTDTLTRGAAEYEPWMLIRANDGSATGGVSYGAADQTAIATTNDGSTLVHTLSISLNTAPAKWVATYYEDGTQLVTYTYTTNPTGTNTINEVSFGSYQSATGTASNFSVVTTPEPSSLGLFGLASLRLLARRRRRGQRRHAT